MWRVVGESTAGWGGTRGVGGGCARGRGRGGWVRLVKPIGILLDPPNSHNIEPKITVSTR